MPTPVYLTQVQQDSQKHVQGKNNYPEVDKARQYGADAKVTLLVVDSKGMPVPQAQVEVAFFPQDSYEAAKITKGLSDAKGIYTVSGKTIDDISFSASKDDYYVTNRKFHFYWRGTECVKDGRWQPWNPTLEVVLKEKRNPIPLYTKQSNLAFPKGTIVGFDCMYGELVAPHGSGKYADFNFCYESKINQHPTNPSDFWAWTNRLSITLTKDGGISKCSQDQFSEFVSLYEAPARGYQPEIVFELARTAEEITSDHHLGEDEYLVFRSRVKTDTGGNLVGVNYGKIYKLTYGESDNNFSNGSVTLEYYFNPTPNDRNLEFDGKTNLFNPGWRENWPRKP